MLLALITLPNICLGFQSSRILKSRSFIATLNSVDTQRSEPSTPRQKMLDLVNKAAKIAPLIPLVASPWRVLSEENIDVEALPYAYDALAPYISEKTMKFHHDKHYVKYVSTTKSMIEGTPLQKESIENIIRKSYGVNQGLFNNAAQAWNHAFYWKGMKANGGGPPSGNIAKLIDKSFGSYADFRQQFASAGNSLFGSGWVWLVSTKQGLKILKTSNADTPLTDKGSKALLTMDVWEHAYYLDYQNLRGSYVDSFLDHLVNWDFVESRLKA